MSRSRDDIAGGTNIKKVQQIMFAAMRDAARHVAQNTDGAIMLATIMGESVAAIVCEIVGKHTDGFSSQESIDMVVAATIGPIEAMLRENIANFLAAEQKRATRQ